MNATKYKHFSVSLPEDMARMVDRAAAMEHRTRSELVREALRRYIERIPVAVLTAKETAADREGRKAFERGDFVTLDRLLGELAPRCRPARRKAAR